MKAQNPLETVTAKKIIEEVEIYLRNNSTFFVVYSNWYCGATNDTDVRKTQHKSKNKKEPALWNNFNARSLNIASAIETYFHDKGMLETDIKGNLKETSKHFYIYKKHPTIID